MYVYPHETSLLFEHSRPGDISQITHKCVCSRFLTEKEFQRQCRIYTIL